MKELQENERKTKCFVGRSVEKHKWNEWLDDSFAPLRLFFISGMGGIGKSSLLSEMMRSAKERNAMGVWLDGRSCTPTPAGFLEYLSVTIGLEAWHLESARPLDFLFHATPNRRVVLCIDNYENLSILEGWLMEAFLPKLPSSGVSVLFASRPVRSLAWKMNPFYRDRVLELSLSYLSFDETYRYIDEAGLFEKEQAEKMAQASDGHPLALALAVEMAAKQNELDSLDKMIVSQTISVHVLRELTAIELQPLVDILVILPHANQEMLSLILKLPVTREQYQQLSELSFVQSNQKGLALHDLARMHLMREFKLRNPSRLDQLRRSAAEILYNRFQTADQEKRRMIASQMIILCKDMFPLHRDYADLSVDFIVPSLEPVLEEDLPILHELLTEWCTYSIDPWQCQTYHDFLDELVALFPESVVALRGLGGKPIGMFITVLLYEDTSRLLMKYFPSELSECCKPHELMCELSKADTYYAVLGAATSALPGYTRGELVGLLTLDRLSLLSEGIRAVLVATDSKLKAFLQKLGFHMRKTKTSNCDTSYAEAHVLELDLRNHQFGEWVMSFFSSPSIEQTFMSTKDLTKREIRNMLASLHEPAELRNFIRFFPGIETTGELQQLILSVLMNKSTGLSERDRNLLYVTYYTHANNRIAAGQACNMSRATFYRHLQQAISNFSDILKTQK